MSSVLCDSKAAAKKNVAHMPQQYVLNTEIAYLQFCDLVLSKPELLQVHEAVQILDNLEIWGFIR